MLASLDFFDLRYPHCGRKKLQMCICMKCSSCTTHSPLNNCWPMTYTNMFIYFKIIGWHFFYVYKDKKKFQVCLLQDIDVVISSFLFSRTNKLLTINVQSESILLYLTNTSFVGSSFFPRVCLNSDVAIVSCISRPNSFTKVSRWKTEYHYYSWCFKQ